VAQPALTADEFSAAVSAVTSAFGDPTRREIYLFAHDSERGVTAAEVAERFDLHPNVARHHLDKLAGGGYLEVAVERLEHPGAGRPSKHYRTVAKDMRLDFPARRDDLLVTLLARTLALVPLEQAEAMAEEVGQAYGHSLAASMAPAEGHRSLQVALHTVADALTAHGFAAHAERHRDGLRIVSDHCPFGGAAIEHPVICAVDRGLVRGMLGALYGEAATATSSSRPMGDDRCVTSITS
jgi:predicted ArsR family transcriptional regulator